MSNLNKAFIQAYKKNHRVLDRHVESNVVRPPMSNPATTTGELPSIATRVPASTQESRSKSGVPAPHFFQPTRSAVQAIPAVAESSVVAEFETPQPIEEVAVIETPPTKMSYRFDTADTTAVLQPWFTAVSTFDLGSFVGLTSGKPGETKDSEPAQPSEVASKAGAITKKLLDEPLSKSSTRIDMPSDTTESVEAKGKPSVIKFDSKPSSMGKVLVTERTSAESYLSNRRSSSTIEVPAIERPSTETTTAYQTPSPVIEKPVPVIKQEVPIMPAAVEESQTIVEAVVSEVSRFEEGRVQESFHAIWEVDSFQWPEVSEKLSSAQPSILNEVGRHLRQANSTGLSVLAVTSAAAGQGRTTVACCIARSAAKVGLSVALIDGDLHHPALADELNLEVTHGWLETVSLNLPLEEAAIHSIEDRITLFPLTNRKEVVSIAPDHPKIQAILRKLAKSFDLVVIDSQHLSHPSYRLMGCGVQTPIDAAVLVVDKNFANNEETNESIRRLSRIGIESVGLVENFQ